MPAGLPSQALAFGRGVGVSGALRARLASGPARMRQGRATGWPAGAC